MRARAADADGPTRSQRATRGLASRQTGRAAEEAAVRFLRSQGLAILLRNFHRRLGELDVIARQRDVLAIIEVRTRSSATFGGAAGSVGRRKQQRIARAAALLLQQRKDLSGLRVRFDVLVVHEPTAQCPRVEWIQHAFPA